MGSPVSPLVADLFLQEIETVALRSFVDPPRLWLRYVDDTFVIIKTNQVEAFHKFLNQQCDQIKFTVECENDQRSLHFLDCDLKVNQHGEFESTVFRKPTHSDLYLNYESAHPKFVKHSLVSSMCDRVRALCSTPNLQEEELLRIKNVLRDNRYPFSIVEKHSGIRQISSNGSKVDQEMIATAGIPYRKDTSEAIKKILKDYRIRTFFRIDNTLKRHLMKPKDSIKG